MIDEQVERIANAIAARRRPSYERWVRKRGGKSSEGHYEMTEPGDAGDATMTTFTDTDGCPSIRSLTWREVTAEVLAELAAPPVCPGERDNDE